MLKDQTIVCISSIDWDYIWQSHQEIMSTLAANGNRVLFVENTGVRRPNLRDMPRLRSRIRNWWNSTRGFREVRDNLFVYAPMVVPLPYSRVARWINRRIIGGAIRKWMTAMDVRHPVAWTFLPSPLAIDVCTRLDAEVIVYHCADDFAATSAAARGIRAHEDRLLREADLVFVTSRKLKAKAETQREHAALLPSGVNFSRFDEARRRPDPIPEDLQALGGPVAGYVGGLHRFVDQEMVAAAARANPEVKFVLIGPVISDVSVLDAEPNIHLLGTRAHEELPGYLRGFDVGLIPYVVSEYTESVYPSKLNEYLAMGLPVVSTALPEILEIGRQDPAVLTISTNVEQFAEAVSTAVEPAGPQAAEHRIDYARNNAWEARIEEMSGLIEEKAREKRSQQGRWDARLERIYRMARQRALASVALAFALYVLFFHTPLIWGIAAPLRVEEPPRPADAIVVLAAGVGESGQAGGGYQERVQHAVQLYEAGFAPEMVFSSGYVFAFREADIMRNLAIDQGVPPEAIVLERESGSTHEMVTNLRSVLQTMEAETVLLVSSPYHMRRAVWTWEELAPDIAVIPSPVQYSQFYARIDAVRLEQIRGIVWEYAAIVVYWLRGWI